MLFNFKQTMYPVFVPERFRNAIALHILKNILWDFDFRVPLILGIHGPSGEGKTFQCETALREMGVEHVSISGREFESANAGEPAVLLEERYHYASGLMGNGGPKYVALVIQDLDACLGTWAGNVQYTVNTQLVTATLMAIADNPLRGGAANRVPIIATGNDFTKLYAPLVREGRMASFTWCPSLEEKVSIVQSIFSAESISADDVSALVGQFSQMPVAFFSLLKTTIFDEQLLAMINRVGMANVVDYALNLPDGSLKQPSINLEFLVKAADRLLNNQLINHLKLSSGD